MDSVANNVGILSIKDEKSRILQCNSVFLEYVGVNDKEKIIGTTDYDLPWHEYADVYRQHELDVISGNEYSIIFPIITAKNEHKIFLHNKIAEKRLEEKSVRIKCHATKIINPNINLFFKFLAKMSPSEKNIFYSRNKSTPPGLTQREKEILWLLAKGRTTKAIGKILEISPKTVACHIANCKTKLNCHTKNELIDKSYEHNISQLMPNVDVCKQFLHELLYK